MTDPAERNKALAAARAAAPPGPRRLFVGKTSDKAATVSLADADGKPRLNITVDATGNPRIEFLDAEGKVVARIPEKSGPGLNYFSQRPKK
jgi:ABC-type amino acid transport substrate-binding protein